MFVSLLAGGMSYWEGEKPDVYFKGSRTRSRADTAQRDLDPNLNHEWCRTEGAAEDNFKCIHCLPNCQIKAARVDCF